MGSLGLLNLSTKSAVQRRRVLTRVSKSGIGALRQPSLYLLRILSSLRVAWQHKRDTKIHLRAISQFFTNLSDGWELSQDFLNAGGVQLVIEIVSEQPSEEALNLLTTSCRRFGRFLKEPICESENGVLIQALLVHLELLDAGVDLLIELHVGNPKHLELLKTMTMKLLAIENSAEIRSAGASVVRALISRDSPFYLPEILPSYVSEKLVRTFVLSLACENRNVRYKSLVILRCLADFGEAAHQVIILAFVQLLLGDKAKFELRGDDDFGCEALTTAKRLASSVLLHLVRNTRGETKTARLLELVIRCRLDRVLLKLLSEIKVRRGRSSSSDLVESVAELLSALFELDYDDGEIQTTIRTVFNCQQVLSMLVWNPQGFRDAFIRNEIPTINTSCIDDFDENEHRPSSIFLTECSTSPPGGTTMSPSPKDDENFDDHDSVDQEEHDLMATTPKVSLRGFSARSPDGVIERLKRQHRLRGEFRLDAENLSDMLVHESSWTLRPRSPVCRYHKPRSSSSPHRKVRPTDCPFSPKRPASQHHRQVRRHKGSIIERDHGIIGIIAPNYDLQ